MTRVKPGGGETAYHVRHGKFRASAFERFYGPWRGPVGMTASGPAPAGVVRLFLAGDVMLGRGIDQILAQPGDPTLHEQAVKSARTYVALAESASGPLPRSVEPDYVWGALLDDLDRRQPDLRFVNLETAITTSDRFEPKGINYRMHPANAPVLKAAVLDAVALANNHVLDWGREGLLDTLSALDGQGVAHAGAGRSDTAAETPAVLPLQGGRRCVFLSFGDRGSGIPAHWGAGPGQPGIAILPDGVEAVLAAVDRALAGIRRPGDLVVMSVHWGANWGYDVPARHREIAHALIEGAGLDIVHGHSSHHPMAAELHRGKLVLYGCGDLINDYEGISGYEAYRGDLSLGYLADLDRATGALRGLEMIPYRIRRFRLEHPGEADVAWLRDMMARECGKFGLAVRMTDAETLALVSPEAW